MLTSRRSASYSNQIPLPLIPHALKRFTLFGPDFYLLTPSNYDKLWYNVNSKKQILRSEYLADLNWDKCRVWGQYITASRPRLPSLWSSRPSMQGAARLRTMVPPGRDPIAPGYNQEELEEIAAREEL